MEVALTKREMQVVALIDRGLSNKEIARELDLEISTIKNHAHSILAKYNVRRRVQAAAVFKKQNKGFEPTGKRR